MKKRIALKIIQSEKKYRGSTEKQALKVFVRQFRRFMHVPLKLLKQWNDVCTQLTLNNQT